MMLKAALEGAAHGSAHGFAWGLVLVAFLTVAIQWMFTP